VDSTGSGKDQKVEFCEPSDCQLVKNDAGSMETLGTHRLKDPVYRWASDHAKQHRRK